MSLPSLGAWIETGWRGVVGRDARSRSLHWERGLKLLKSGQLLQVIQSRSLHWERGLKLVNK